MVAVVVTANNTRINPADAVTNWGNDGGGGGIAVETDIVYQNAAAMSRKISTTRIGRDYTHGSGTNTTTTDLRHMLAKVTVTNPAALLTRTSPAMGLKIGSGSGAYYEVYLAGSDNYPARGGWLLVPISMNVSGYRDATTGSPSLTSVLYWSILSDFSAGSKAENVVIDAIDYGAGLHLVGGDSPTAAADFADFVTFDEGTTTNRFGYAFTEGSIKKFNGRMEIGRNASGTASKTRLTSVGEVLVWGNGYAETGYHRLKVDLTTAGTEVSISGGTIISEGEKNNTVGGLGYSTTEDTRLILEVTGAGTGSFCNLFGGEKLVNLADLILNANSSLDTVDVQTESMTQGSADVENCTIRTTSVANVATLTDPVFGTTTDLHDTEFVQEGAGHAIELSAVGATVTLPNMTWTGYGADASSSAAIYVSAATGTTTINWSGGTEPTYRTAGATVVLVASPATITVTVTDNDTGSPIQNAYVLAWCTTDASPSFPSLATVTLSRSGSTVTVTHTTHGLTTGDEVRISGNTDNLDLNGIHTITVTGASEYTYTVSTAREVETFKGILSTPASTGNVSYTGIGFKPKGIRVWAIQTTAETLAIGAINMEGYADAKGHEICVGSRRDGNSSGGARQHSYMLIELQREQDQNDLAQATLVSFDADGFTLNWDLTSAGYEIHFECFGGYGVQCHVGEMQHAADGGEARSPLIPFKANLIFGANIFKDIVGGDTNPRFGFGVAGVSTSGVITQWGIGTHYGSFGGTTSQYHTFSTIGLCVGQNGATLYNVYRISAVDSTGFTTKKYSGTNDDTWMIYLAIKAPDAYVGNTTKSTGGAPATQTLPTFGFTPQMYGVASSLATVSAVSTQHVSITRGSYDGTNQGMVSNSSEDGAHNSQSIQNNDEIAHITDQLGASLAQGVASAITDSTPDIVWDPNDAVARRLGIWALPIPATGGAKASSLVLINGYTNASGVIADVREYSTDQNIAGTVSKGTSSPTYVRAGITGTVDSVTGLPVSVALVSDQ